ncbi:hypothetical protein LX36DRAFT_653298 [Colletotrichum falcatum]|nr:hypothetical protein LX36DRAFT_653298 [Colletotrichum falcatum]
MATPRANEEVLKVILTKLHRLETAFNQINSRLSTIESSVVSHPGGRSFARPFSSLHLASCCCASCTNPQPLQQDRHRQTNGQHPAAAVYKFSVEKLRNQFDFDGSSVPPAEEGTINAHNSEGRSKVDDNHLVSDCPPRPASPHDICHRDTKPVPDGPKKQPLRYEDAVPRAEPMESPGHSRSSSVSSPTKAGSLLDASKPHSQAGTLSGHPSPCWSGRNSRDDTFKNTRGPIRRARSMRRKTKSSTTQKNASLLGPANDTVVVDPTLIRRLEEKEFLRLYRIAHDSARACITLGQRMMHVVSRGGPTNS